MYLEIPDGMTCKLGNKLKLERTIYGLKTWHILVPRNERVPDRKGRLYVLPFQTLRV